MTVALRKISTRYEMMLRSKVFDLMIPTDFSAFHAPESLRAATVGAKRTSTGRSAP